MKGPFAMKVPLLENANCKGYNEDEHSKVIEIKNTIDSLHQIE
jgi:hypothetical protein